jgi:iron complex outermembrane receptor protein
LCDLAKTSFFEIVEFFRFRPATIARHHLPLHMQLRNACILLTAASAASPASTALAQNPQPLDTIRVIAAPHTRSIQIITRRDIQQLGARTIHDALKRAPAAAVDILDRSPASADVAIRGTALGQVLVLVDGVRMTDRQTPHFDLDLAVPIADIERIEILRGPASALYGADAVGGVINIVTTPTTPTTPTSRRAELRAGTFNTAAAALALPHISGEYDRSTGHRPGTDYRSTQARASLGDRTLGASIGQSVRDFGANSFYGPYDSHERTATTTAELHAAHTLTRDLISTTALSTRRHADQFTLRRTDPAFYRNRHASLQSALTTTLRHRSNLTFGADLQHAYLTSARLGERRDVTGALFAQTTIANAIDLGVRSDWSNGFGTFVSPSIAASHRLASHFTLRANASRAFRAPSWTERYYSDPANLGNPDLSAERFTVAELGARIARLDLAAWARRGTDVIDWVKPTASPTSQWQTQNISTINYRGIDAELTLPTRAGVSITTNASFLDFDATSAAGYTGKYALRPLTSSVGARADVAPSRRLTFTVDARHFLRATESASHLTANAHIALRVPHATITAHLENLTNADYLDVTGKPVAGREIVVGVAWP